MKNINENVCEATDKHFFSKKKAEKEEASLDKQSFYLDK